MTTNDHPAWLAVGSRVTARRTNATGRVTYYETEVVVTRHTKTSVFVSYGSSQESRFARKGEHYYAVPRYLDQPETLVPNVGTVEEQARAQAEREYPPAPIMFRGLTHPAEAMREARVGGYIQGYRAGHEAATRTREVTTGAELDDLLTRIDEANTPEAAVILADRPYIVTRDEWGDWWAWSFQYEGEDEAARPLADVPLPFRVLHTPEEAS